MIAIVVAVGWMVVVFVLESAGAVATVFVVMVVGTIAAEQKRESMETAQTSRPMDCFGYKPLVVAAGVPAATQHSAASATLVPLLLKLPLQCLHSAVSQTETRAVGAILSICN